MKKLNLILAIVFLFTVVFIGCKKEDDLQPEKIVPQNFKVEIPSSLSSTSNTKSANGDTLSGGEIYGHLRFFIAVGEGAADIVQGIMRAIGQHGLNQAMSFSFTSDDDGRVKNVNIVESADFEGKTYEYLLTMTDALSENEADGGMAMQVYWDRDPIIGSAILKSYNINRNNPDKLDQAMIRIDYSETGTNGYEKQMVVYISDLPVADPQINKYSISSMKMFAGQNGDIVEVFGNSNHPNATFHSGDYMGFNWAFVGAADTLNNISVAEVGLPASTLDSDSRQVILVDNSIKNVFTREISAWIFEEWGFVPTEEQLEPYLQNTNAPGYFSNGGFVAAGTAPNSNYSAIEAAILELVPYNPLSVTNLKVEFNLNTTK